VQSTHRPQKHAMPQMLHATQLTPKNAQRQNNIYSVSQIAAAFASYNNNNEAFTLNVKKGFHQRSICRPTAADKAKVFGHSQP